MLLSGKRSRGREEACISVPWKERRKMKVAASTEKVVKQSRMVGRAVLLEIHLHPSSNHPTTMTFYDSNRALVSPLAHYDMHIYFCHYTSPLKFFAPPPPPLSHFVTRSE